jgi:hypothetical protein
MIWRPKPGTRVRLRYRPDMRPLTGLHLATGTVEVAGRGPGPINAAVPRELHKKRSPCPINAAVRLEDGRRVVVPRGNLFQVET